MADKIKPRLRFCWHCGRQLQANYFAEYSADDGNIYIVHKQCFESLSGGFVTKSAVDDANNDDANNDDEF